MSGEFTKNSFSDSGRILSTIFLDLNKTEGNCLLASPALKLQTYVNSNQNGRIRVEVNGLIGHHFSWSESVSSAPNLFMSPQKIYANSSNASCAKFCHQKKKQNLIDFNQSMPQNYNFYLISTCQNIKFSYFYLPESKFSSFLA